MVSYRVFFADGYRKIKIMALSSILLKVRVLMPVLFIFVVYSLSSPADEKFDWRSDWSLKENFDISIDTEGYRFPTAIAFVPNPGNGPKDPLYFVTELRGKVKVVTNDRTVYTFAKDFFTFKPLEELPLTEWRKRTCRNLSRPRKRRISSLRSFTKIIVTFLGTIS